MVDLKPCPFCGGDKIWVAGPTCKASDPYNPLDRLYPITQCRGCHAEVPGKNEDYSYNQRTAVSAWNTRPDASRISALEAENARLREALQPFWEVSGEMFARNYNKEQIIWGAERGEIEFRLRFKHFLEARAALGDDHD
jgi:hypothetical protein